MVKVKIGKFPKRRWYHRLLGLEEGDQKVKVKIDHYDIWNVDKTLSYIIVPLLKDFRENLCGIPRIDFDDAPAYLQPDEDEKKLLQEHGEVSDYCEKRWKYILDEMIYAFESDLINDEDAYWIEEPSFSVEDGTVKKVSGEFDKEGYQWHQERVQNGRRLFAKYYNALWT